MIRVLFLMSLVAATFAQTAWAGVFNSTHFVTPGEFSIGVEPELTLTQGAGLAGNLKYTQGITDTNNLGIIIGNGGGERKFRIGSNLTFDFFPDTGKQPGIGLAVQGMYYRLASVGQLELSGYPYIHKSFITHGSNEIEPYLAVPLGMTFTDGQYKTFANVSIGSLFKTSEHFRYIAEVGVSISNSSSYIAGGIAYYH